MQGGAQRNDWSELVQTLRAFHTERDEKRDEVGVAVSHPIALRRSAGSKVVPRDLVERLRAVHEGREDVRGGRDAPEVYERVRELFRKRERDLRKEELVVDGILAKMRSGQSPASDNPVAPLQQNLRLLCSAGGSSRGKFIVANETQRDCRVRFRLGRLRGGAPNWLDSIAFRFSPNALEVSPGGTLVAELAVDLSRCPAVAGDRLELPIDLHSDETRLGRLWLEVVVVEVTS